MYTHQHSHKWTFSSLMMIIQLNSKEKIFVDKLDLARLGV